MLINYNALIIIYSRSGCINHSPLPLPFVSFHSEYLFSFAFRRVRLAQVRHIIHELCTPSVRDTKNKRTSVLAQTKRPGYNTYAPYGYKTHRSSGNSVETARVC